MKIKSFFAGTIREAIDRARAELGPEAMIIASRKTSGEQQKLGEYEVVCGVHRSPAPEAQTRPLERKAPASESAPTGMARARSLLDRAGLGSDVVSEFLGKIRSAARRKADPVRELASELRSRLRTAPVLGRQNAARKVVALVGPPGAGKTTTLVKLAVRYGLTARKPLHIVSMDGYRVAGTDALKTYAAAMGTGFDGLETAASLAQKLEEHTGKGMILIDTPGIGPGDVAGFAPLASLLSRHPEIDVHLVLPASMSAADMDATFARFRPCLPEKLLFTGLDMALSCGPALSLSLKTEKPVSFLGTGQQIPEDLEEADPERLIRRVVPEAASATSAA